MQRIMLEIVRVDLAGLRQFVRHQESERLPPSAIGPLELDDAPGWFISLEIG